MSIYALRCEARLLSARIEDAEITAHSLRKLIDAGELTNADEAAEQAALAEQRAWRMASRLSRITREIGGYF